MSYFISISAILFPQIQLMIYFILGAMLYAFSELEWMSSSLTLSAALLLGTICSAVDPVAVNIFVVLCSCRK